MHSLRRLAFTAFCLGAGLGLLAAVGGAADKDLDPGFRSLLQADNLTGWQTKAGESLEGQAEAYKGRFVVREGVLILDPQVKGDVTIQTVEKFGGDLDLKFEFQPGPGCNNDLFLRGIKFDITKANVKNLVEGEWNRFEIVIRGDQAEFRNNGELQRTATAKPEPTPFGIRAEFKDIRFRRLQVKTAAAGA